MEAKLDNLDNFDAKLDSLMQNNQLQYNYCGWMHNIFKIKIRIFSENVRSPDNNL